eukprot:CAMPEP_0184012876 /NCGR_PEP_ID=MMETSP0954-20121128/4690_1 /TAXON_ID=627963 /ORGANISM="Aplanochytrium sp, Strain PBS07" /LENGTH=276 /DNA_ID=CAMNT_0026292981 /DNA_START=411 /DNA_END=1241 /DNA_ORIENTATION=-
MMEFGKWESEQESESENDEVILLKPQCLTPSDSASSIDHALSKLSLTKESTCKVLNSKDENVEKESIETHPKSAKPATGSDLKQIVVVLDLNGLFVERIRGNFPSDSPLKKKRTKKLMIYFRPHHKDFIDLLFKNFDIVIWSSARQGNIDDMIAALFTNKQKKKVKMVYNQDHCTYIGDHPDVPNKPLFLKELSRLWEKFGTPKNTLMLDDSPLKASRNPAYTAIHPKPWSHTDIADRSLCRDGALYKYFENLAKYRQESDEINIPEYIRSNPFKG